MATTAIWDVKGWLGKVVLYAENPEKTENPAYAHPKEMTDQEMQGLGDVIAYAMKNEKTDMQYFVSGVNCLPSTARTEIMAVKKRFGKDEGIMAFHGYQSFGPGEVTPDLAHEIGLKMAQKLWGERFQVIVATHLDKAHHIHNHFVINSVSFLDGKRYNDCTATYMEMRKASDELCREYSLSIIEDPQRGKARQYGEWKAEREDYPTWRGLIKADVDEAISKAFTQRQFFENLQRLGYEVKTGKDISVRPPGKERFVRLMRNFGEAYSLEQIQKRILTQARRQHPIDEESRKPKVYQLRGNIRKGRKLSGLRALYYHYCFKMGIMGAKKNSNKKAHFLFREDLRKMGFISKEAELLGAHHIDTAEQLFSYRAKLEIEFKSLCIARKHLRSKAAKPMQEEKKQEMKEKISALTKQILSLRKEIGLCEKIVVRSGEMKEKLKTVEKQQIAKRKERMNIEYIGRCGGTDRPDVAERR